MIRTPTTFVIGAGASFPYGLPIGQELVRRARKLQSSHPDIYQLIVRSSITPNELNAFLEDLNKHTAESIDSYLETRETEKTTMKVGKYVIAGLMAEELRLPIKIPRTGDWLGYVFAQMREGTDTAKDFAEQNKNVTFVTFNFDTIIEDRFRHDLSRTFKDWKDEIPRVIHVHGTLASTPVEEMARNVISPHFTPDFSPNWKEWLMEASASINIILDDIPDETLSSVRTAIRNASVVCFLGFAYATGNLARLGIPDTLKWHAKIFGSAYKVFPGHQHTIRERFHQDIQLGHQDHDCLNVLLHLPIFQD